MNQQTLIQELEEVFNKIAEIIQGNDLGYAGGQRRANFKSASLLVRCEPSTQQFAELTAPGVLVFLRPDKEPFLGVMGRIDFRRGGAAELRALLARLQKGKITRPFDRQAA